jgi:hypothetical protein
MLTDPFLNTDFNEETSGDQLQSPDFAINSSEQAVETDPPVNSFSNMMNQGIQTAAKEAYTPKADSLEYDPFAAQGAKVKYHAPEIVDKYHAQEGFNPRTYQAELEDYNLQTYADKETWTSALAKGFDSFAFNFGNTFTGWFADYPKMVDALFSMDWDKMKPDEESLINDYYAMQKNMNENFVFAEAGHEDDIFSKKFVSEFIGNSGYALGTTFALGLEIGADILITAATEGGGIGSFAATGARFTAKAAAREAAKTSIELASKGNKFTNIMQDVFKGFNAGMKEAKDIPRALGLTDEAASVSRQMQQAEAVANMSRSKRAISPIIGDYSTMLGTNIFNIGKSKSISEATGTMLKSTPLLGSTIRFAEKGLMAAREGASAAQVIGIGLQGTRRIAQELNMSASEAYFEAISSYGDTLDKMGKQHLLENNGDAPTFEQFNEMKTLATKASSSNYDTNMGILLVTNHLQFGNVFSKFIPQNKFAQDLLGEASERVLTVTSKKGLEGVYKKHAIFGTMSTLGKVSKDFGKKEALYQFGKSAFKNVARFEVTEGLQENIQETSAAGWKDYYAGQFNGTKYTLQEAMGRGLSSQFSKQGWKTFLMGAMTGSLIRLPSRVLNVAVEKTNKTLLKQAYAKEGMSDPYAAFDKQLTEDIALLNSFIKKGKNGNFETKLFNFNNQSRSAIDQTAAAAVGSEYDFHNGKDNALLSAVSAANRTGTTDLFINSIKNSISEMTNEQFKNEFGIEIEDTNYSSPQAFAEKVAGDIKQYNKAIEDFTRAYKTKFEDPTKYEVGTDDYYVAHYIRQAEEDALHIAALNSIKADMALNRAKQIASELQSSPLLANSSDMVLRVLTDPKMVLPEIGILQNQIKVLEANLKEEGLDRETKKQLNKDVKSKVEQLNELYKWASFWDTRKDMAEREENQSSDDTTPVFVGKRIERDMDNNQFLPKDEKRKKTYGERKVKIKNTYHPTHVNVKTVFRKLLLAKNKEAGLNLDITENQIEEALQKLIDYMQLNVDTKDYLSAVEVLTNKERFREITKRMQNGRFKFNMIQYADTLFNNFRNTAKDITLKIMSDTNKEFNVEEYMAFIVDVQDAILKSEAYIKLIALISHKDFGLNKQKEASEYVQEISKILRVKFNDYTGKNYAEQIDKEITDEDYAQMITDNQITIVAKQRIGNLLYKSNEDPLVLSKRESKLYEEFKDEIDLYIKDLKEKNKKEDSLERVEPELEIEKEIDEEVEEIVDDPEQELEQDLEEEVVSEEQEEEGFTNINMNKYKRKKQPEQQEDVEEEVVFENDDIDEGEYEVEYTLEMLESDYKNGSIEEDEYINLKNALLVRDKILELDHENPMAYMTSVVDNIISKINTYAEQDNVSFEKFFNDKNNATLVKEIINKELYEDATGDTLESEPEIEEPVKTPTEDIIKEDIVNINIDDSIFDEILSAVSPAAEEVVSEVSVSDLEAKKAELEEKLKNLDERDTRSLEAITPNNPNHPTFKVGMKMAHGYNVIVEKTNTDNWNAEGEGYHIITAVKSPAEFDSNGKITKAAKVETAIFNSKEEADAAVQTTFERVKSLMGKAQQKIKQELAAVQKDVEITEKNVNFVSEVVTEQSIYEALKNANNC